MNYFNGRFDIEDGGFHDETHYRLLGKVVDNSGTYFAADAQVGDIIYIDGSPIGVPLLRYKIAEVNYDETRGATLSVLVTWDMIEGIEPQEPFGGLEGIIGSLHSNGLTANITPVAYNSVNEVLVANVNSYQSMLLGLNSGGGDGSSPDLTEVNKKIKALESKVESVQLEWEDLINLAFE